MKTKDINRFAFFAFLILLNLAYGTLGFMIIEEWPWFDSLYMTAITLTTVGYGEIHPLSYEGRIFAMSVMFFGIGLVFVGFTSISQWMVERQYSLLFGGKKMIEKIQKLSNHVIICGFGRLSRIVAAELTRIGTPCVIVDKDPNRAKEARDEDYLVHEGDATLEETLQTVGIKRAKWIVSLLPKDSDNLYVVLTSKELSPGIKILSRAEDEPGEKRLSRAGASRIVFPYRAGGQKIAAVLTRPIVADFVELAVSGSSGHLQIEEVKIPDSSPLVGRSLHDAGLRSRTNVIVAAIVSNKGDMLFNPSGESPIEAGATFIALGRNEDLAKFEKICTEG